MSVVIRLARFGKRGAPTYRIAVIEKQRKRNSAPIEVLGNYIPSNHTLTINEKRLAYWTGQGALPSPTVIKLMHDRK